MKINSKEFKRASIRHQLTPGDALRILRELQELSQNQLAELTGISQSNISALERGVQQMGRDRAMTLAESLHVHPSVLLFPDFDIRKVA